MNPLFENLPSSIRQRLLSAARGGRLVFPEGNDERVQSAAEILVDQANISCELLNSDKASAFRLKTLEVIEKQAQRRGKSVTPEMQEWASDPFFTAGAWLELGLADAAVGGAVATTAHVIRAALNTVGVDPHAPLITSCFLFRLCTPTAGGEEVVLYADAGVVPQPSSQQLVQIAALSADAFRRWTQREPRVGFLSFSTRGSAHHPDVEKVRQAAQSFATLRPDVVSEGELQFDAAVEPTVALRKNPHSPLAGRTNVFVFPDLDAGNIAYKITQRLAGAEAWGPLLMGTAKPYSDLSRGATAMDIAHVALLTLVLGRAA